MILDEAKKNYTTIEKEFEAIVSSLENFKSYPVSSKVIIYIDQSTLQYLLGIKSLRREILVTSHFLKKLLWDT